MKKEWRSLEEYERPSEQKPTPEFPTSFWDAKVSRRDALRIAAAVSAAALAACRRPFETIATYVEQPAGFEPGEVVRFATSLPRSGYARGMLVDSRLGRPTKVEGHPEHPDSLGATDALAQAEIFQLYDPDRSQAVTRAGSIATLGDFLGELEPALKTQRDKHGAGLQILTGCVTSPALAARMEALARLFPKMKWRAYEPVGEDHARAGTKMAFGREASLVYRLDRADVVAAFDADVLHAFPGHLRHARSFAGRRRPEGQRPMNRLYVAEPAPSITGANADHRLPLAPSGIDALARALATELGVSTARGSRPPAGAEAFLRALAADLKRRRGACLVLCGESRPPEIHALVHAMNAALGNFGRTVDAIPRVDHGPAHGLQSLRELGADLDAGKVDALFILGANPVFDAPADLRFAERLGRAGFAVHLGLYHDETAAGCRWHLPAAHALESWGDARASDGTATFAQPLIAPLYGGMTAGELLSILAGKREGDLDGLKRVWNGKGDWEEMTRRGFLRGSAFKAFSAKVNLHKVPSPPAGGRGQGEGETFELILRPHHAIWDGSYANNAWLQELPEPLTRLTWDNVVQLGPSTARALGVSSGDVVELNFRGAVVEGPAWVQPGHADGCATVTLGHGRTRAGRWGDGAGFDAYRLRRSDAPWGGTGLSIRPLGKRVELASTQGHDVMEGRDLARSGTLADYRRRPGLFADAPPPRSMYPAFPASSEHAWGMAIDLGTCIACGACVAACQAENNIPTVGKEQVLKRRAMHWLRVDRYFKGEPEAPEILPQPVPCMHCEDAPCEVVCPVEATSHSREGLNEMTYNRCVGTRYCSNNCPYKVRRFNFLQYADLETPSLRLGRNPEVTVRGRGVMEKCTYCVQRIETGKIRAEREGRPIADGEIKTACQQVCPADAIVFGDLKNPKSRVSRLKALDRNYALLGELNTRPRTTYLARLKNPNPELES